MRYLATPSGLSRCRVNVPLAWGRCVLLVGLAVTTACGSTKPRARLVLNDAAAAGSGGSGGGTGGAGGTDAAAGTGGSAAADAAPADAAADRQAADAGPPIPCSITVTSNTYDPLLPGCGGVAMCKGVIGYTNNSPVTLTYPTLRFSVPVGVTCLRSHSASRWIIADDGAVSHQCVFTTNLLAAPWNVLPNGTFRFGYDVTDGVTPPLPTDVTIGDGACPIPDGGLDGPGATDGAQVDQRDGQALLDARDGAGN